MASFSHGVSNCVSRTLLFVTVLLASLGCGAPVFATTAMQSYVDAMQPGTNWGNTLDAVPNETAWGAPLTTQPMIQGLAAKGYKSLRLPVTWNNHMGPAPDYTIDPAWMDRVQQIVDWALAADLYVMLNLHHDGWTGDMGHDHDAVLDRFEKVWLQIATRFKDYPSKLSFESRNEPGFQDANGHDLPAEQMRILLDELNTTFVDIVRATGGGNATRPLVLPSVYTSADQPMIDSLKTTMANLNDPNLIATVHYYSFYPFSVNMGGVTKFDDLVKNWVEVPFNAVHDTFVANGIPVVIGEWGVLGGNNIERGELLKYHEYAMQYARKKGLTMMLWDTGGVYNRTTQDWQPDNRDLAEIIKQAETGRATTSESDLLFLKSETVNQDSVINLNLNGNTVVSVQDGDTTLVPTTDYTLAGSVLTIKSSVLAKYVSAPFGPKTTLTIKSNSGPAWKIHVRYAATPVASALTSFSGTSLSIPTAFSGDLLATIESRYADGTNAGPVGWSAFPFWGDDFHPDYANNAIVLSSGFLAGAPANSVINFNFHFWSGKVLTYQMQVKPPVSISGPDYVFYDDSIPGGWYDWNSWMPHDLASTAKVHSGSKSISITPNAWGGVTLQNGWGQVVDTSVFRTLVFWVHGGDTGGQSIGLHLIFGDDWNSSTWVGLPALVANTWQKIEIPLSNLNAEGRTNITGVSFRHFRAEDAPTFYIDDIYLSTAYASWQLEITGTPTATPPAPSFEIIRNGIHVDNNTNRLVQTVQVRNTGSTTIAGPIYLVLDGLSTNATLANATGWTEKVVPVGTPYITLSTAALAPGKKVSVTLEFSSPTPGAGGLPGGFNHAVTYTPRVLSRTSTP